MTKTIVYYDKWDPSGADVEFIVIEGDKEPYVWRVFRKDEQKNIPFNSASCIIRKKIAMNLFTFKKTTK